MEEREIAIRMADRVVQDERDMRQYVEYCRMQRQLAELSELVTDYKVAFQEAMNAGLRECERLRAERDHVVTALTNKVRELMCEVEGK